MSQWSKSEPIINTIGKAKVWRAAIHYRKDNGVMWFNKIEMYAPTEEEVERLQNELLGFLQSQEMCGITHG